MSTQVNFRKPASVARGHAASLAARRGVERATATIVPTGHGWCIMLPDVTMVFSRAQGHTEADVEAAAVHLARQGIRVLREGC